MREYVLHYRIDDLSKGVKNRDFQLSLVEVDERISIG